MKAPISRFTVYGNSMIPTLHSGQDVLSFNWAYIGRKPKVGEIIVLSLNGRDLIKRIEKIMGDEVWVMGDNRAESTDSRDFGTVAIESVVGKVVYSSKEIPCPKCGSAVIGIYGRKDALCKNCGFKLSCCGEP
jgi:nickel-type superoxide dismutase maturation protease